ncbi:MAG: iron-sulfur cluster assembly accessory protein [Buchnera aphidicola (Meitanaphis flavogallis)]
MNENTYITLFSTKKYAKNVKGIKISYHAEKQIYKLIQKENKKGIKLGIKKSGCAGMKYYMEPIKTIHDTDISFISQKILILINFQHILILDGTKIDFVKKGINYIFQFKNNKIRNFCGCGESFDI